MNGMISELGILDSYEEGQRGGCMGAAWERKGRVHAPISGRIQILALAASPHRKLTRYVRTVKVSGEKENKHGAKGWKSVAMIVW